METLGKLLNFFLYGTQSRKDYYTNMGKIRQSNLKILQLSSLCLFIIHSLVLLVILSLGILKTHINVYILVCTGCLIFFTLSKTLLKKKPNWILSTFYAFSVLILAYSAYIGIFINTENFSVTFCVLLFAIPVLIIDRPIRMTIILLAINIAFCITSAAFKNFTNTATDCLNAMACGLSGLVVFYYIVNIKMHEIGQTILIEKERDTDSVTGLFNKKAVERLISKSLAEKPEGGAFLILDLDDFKFINDTYGHKTGDDILFGLGFCVYNIFSTKDICGRFGGDEFIIYMAGQKDRNIISRYASRLQAFIQNEIVLANYEKTVNCSIGISVFPDDAADYSTLLIQADKALYKAKKSGKNKFCFYDMAAE